ncbi:glycosyltransferase [Microbacterium sp. che218]|uniref:glycosyltransferase n=1 Tax=Microbacterium sp. che218 TaxID=3140649 RepID=UPI00336C0620
MFGAAARSASIVVTPSEHSARRILERWPGSVVRVIPWPASPDKPSRILPLEGRPTKVLVVASTDSHKRLEMGLSVLARLRASNPSLIATFVTRPGNAEDRFLRMVHQVDPKSSWISLMSGVSEEQLAHEYGSAKILLVPSLDEGFCLPVIEAAKYGTPTVHVDRGALPEVAPWPGARGGTNDADDEALLLSRAKLLMEDGAAWQAAHEHALNIPSRFASADFIDAWQEVVEVVTGENRNTARK